MMHHLRTVFLFVLLLFHARCEYRECSGFPPSYIDITGLSGMNMLLQDDTYFSADTLPANAEVYYAHYGLQILPQGEYYSHQQQEESQVAGFFPPAYACSPAEPEPSEEIADIAVFSSADYTQANSSRILAAGDTLNAVFEIYEWYSGRIVGLPDFLADSPLKAYDRGFVLRPVVKPAAAQTHQFTVHYRLTNGEFYTVTADSIRLSPEIP